jgi:hypothetical protein
MASAMFFRAHESMSAVLPHFIGFWHLLCSLCVFKLVMSNFLQAVHQNLSGISS